MLVLADRAAAHLEQLFAKQGLAEGVALRSVHEGDGIRLQSDNERDGDAVIQHDGRSALPMDADVSALLSGDRLEVVDGTLTLRHARDNAQPTS